MPAIAAQQSPTTPSPDPYTRYFARVDQHLEGLARSEHLPFLKAQRNRFIQAYGDFTADVDNGIDRPNENAADYVTIIAELGARVRREEARQ